MNPNGGIGRFFSRTNPPVGAEVLQIRQLQCEVLVKEFPSLHEDVIVMFLDEAHSKNYSDPLDKARSWLAEQVAEQNLNVPLVPRDHGQPSGSLGAPRSIDTPPFQAEPGLNPFGFHDSSSWHNDSSWPSLHPGFSSSSLSSERTPAHGPPQPSKHQRSVKSEPPEPEMDDFYSVDIDIKLRPFEESIDRFIKETEVKKEENEKLRQKFRELYSKCRDPMLIEYMNLVDSEEKLDKNIRNLQEILKSMGVSSDNSDNAQTGK